MSCESIGNFSYRKVTRVTYDSPFQVGEFSYQSLSELLNKEIGSYGNGWIYEDVCGNTVLYFARRVPCFDSSDYTYDWRYWRLYYILPKGSIKMRITNKLSVTEASLVCGFGDKSTKGWIVSIYEGLHNTDGSDIVFGTHYTLIEER